jgi:hypothetical protein
MDKCIFSIIIIAEIIQRDDESSRASPPLTTGASMAAGTKPCARSRAQAPAFVFDQLPMVSKLWVGPHEAGCRPSSIAVVNATCRRVGWSAHFDQWMFVDKHTGSTSLRQPADLDASRPMTGHRLKISRKCKRVTERLVEGLPIESSRDPSSIQWLSEQRTCRIPNLGLDHTNETYLLVAGAKTLRLP